MSEFSAILEALNDAQPTQWPTQSQWPTQPPDKQEPDPPFWTTPAASGGDGLHRALCNPGSQDRRMFVKEEGARSFRDFRDVWLGERHTTTYRKIDVAKAVRHGSFAAADGTRKPTRTLVLTLSRTCDLVGELDLALGLGASIESVEVEIGGQRVDKVDFDETLLEALSAVHGRLGGGGGGTRFVPLLLAPFHRGNLLPLVALQHHPVKVSIEFGAGEIPDEDLERGVELYGDVYFLEAPMRRRLCDEPISMGVAQCQWGASERSFAVKLCCNHPVTALVFWGFDRGAVTNVRLVLDGSALYDGPLEALERAKEARLGPLAACVLFLTGASTPPWSDRQASVNFSRIDCATLEIASTQELGPDERVHVRAVTLQPLRIAAGMAGLEFSK